MLLTPIPTDYSYFLDIYFWVLEHISINLYFTYFINIAGIVRCIMKSNVLNNAIV